MNAQTIQSYIRVRVAPNMPREEVVEHSPGLWHIRIREKPRMGAANTRVKAVLAKHLNVPPGQLRLIKGATSPSKTYLLTNPKHHANKH